jgi:hypothetical protein
MLKFKANEARELAQRIIREAGRAVQSGRTEMTPIETEMFEVFRTCPDTERLILGTVLMGIDKSEFGGPQNAVKGLLVTVFSQFNEWLAEHPDNQVDQAPKTIASSLPTPEAFETAVVHFEIAINDVLHGRPKDVKLLLAHLESLSAIAKQAIAETHSEQPKEI